MKYTADVVAVDSEGRVLVIRRKWEPFVGCWALPGGHVDPEDALVCPEQPSRAGAARELAEETGVTVDPADLIFIGTFDAEGRDPRGPYSTDAYLVRVPDGTVATAADDADEVEWVWIGSAISTAMAFDHADILEAALRTPLGGTGA